MISDEDIIDEVASDCAEWVKDRIRRALELKDGKMETQE